MSGANPKPLDGGTNDRAPCALPGEQEDDVSERESREATARVLHVDDERRSGAFFPAPAAVADKRDEKPLHYKVICISMYTDDLKRLDTMVETLKSRGMTKANRSALIRYALSTVDIEQVPKGL